MALNRNVLSNQNKKEREKAIIRTYENTKKEIIQKVLEGPICLAVPSTCARLHKDAVLYIDDAAAALLS